MAVTSVVVNGPPDAAVLFDTNLRPIYEIKLTGGTGPYNITWEWDTSTGFGSGNLVQAFDTGLTGDGPHQKAPGSDLGGNQTWYFRVLVTDTNDSNTYTHPPSGNHSLIYQDVDLTDSYLHQQSNLGVGFDADEADGAPEDKPRHIYHYHNIGIGFGPGLPDGDPKDFNQFLYNLAYLEPTQPCPWIDYVTPTLAQQTGVVNIVGDSFGATALTWGGEARLYETADLGGTYITLSALSWSDKELTVTIPAGASSGWIAVVHTTGTPTCTGSEMKYITVVQKDPNPDAGWWLQTADPTNQLSVDYTVSPQATVKSSFRKIMNAIGSGRLELPLGDPSITEIMDPVGRKATLVRTYVDAVNRYSWFAETLTHDYNEEGDAVAVISGRGMEAIAQWTSIPPYDAPSSPTQAPTWIFGSNENIIQNGGFEDVIENPPLKNGGGEEGNDDDDRVIGWNTEGVVWPPPTAIAAPTYPYEGDYYILVTPAGIKDGISQSVSVTPNRRYHVRARIKEPTGVGARITMALGGAEDIGVAGSYTNNYKDTDTNEIYGELDNVAPNGSSPGCPGGATDGTWQVIDVEIQTGEEQSSLTIKIRSDSHEDCNVPDNPPFWVDGVEIEGFGLGLDPWLPYDTSKHDVDSFRLVAGTTPDGSDHACYVHLLDGGAGAGIEQKLTVTPNSTYTFRGNLKVSGSTDTWVLAIVDADHKLVKKQAIYPAPSPVAFTPLEITYETETDETEIYLRLTYEGTTVSDPSGVWMDAFTGVPGEPPSTVGVILNQILDAIEAQGKLTYLDRTFSDEFDSRGFAWGNPVAMDIDPTETLFGLLDRITALGYEWEIVPQNFAEGGDTGFELNVYVARPYEPYGGVGTNRTKEIDGPVIMPGDATIGGRVLKSAFNINSVLAIGEGGAWSRVYQHPWLDADIQAWDTAPLGYRDSFGHIEETISVSASDQETITLFAEARLAEEKDKERAIQLLMQRSSILRPFFHFGVGDSLFVDMPPTDPDPPISDGAGGVTRSYPKRVRSIQADLSGEGSDITFQVDIDRVIYEDELAWYARIAQLSERSPANTTAQGTGSPAGSGGTVSIINSGSGASGAVGTHQHSLESTDITNKNLSGDVSGSLPGPVSVNAVRGMPVSSSVPAVTTAGFPADVVWVYDRGTKIWLPRERNIPVMTLASIPLDTQRLKYSSANNGFEPEYEWQELTFSAESGSIVEGTNKFFATEDRIIGDVRIWIGTVAAVVITVDVHLDGTTIFTTQTNRPELAASQATPSDWETPEVTAWDAESYLTVDVDDGAGGENLMVCIRWRVA